MGKIKKYLKNIKFFLLKIYNSESDYVYSNQLNSKWAYISYITGPFNKNRSNAYFAGHQNRQESLIIAEVFKEIGYNFVISDFNSNKIYKQNFDVIFGLEPNFCKMAARNPRSLKIYYATGAYFKHQNNSIKERTKERSEKLKYNFNENRLVKEHSSVQIANIIFQIGTKFTVQTYPLDMQKKIELIDQSAVIIENYNFNRKLANLNDKNEYIWFGSSGSILKGLDLVLDYFLKNPNKTIHVIGPVDDDVLLIYKQLITDKHNIIFYGFINIFTAKFISIIEKCNFFIFPSASEGGCPGSVINLMQLGLIPIVSKYAAPEEIGNIGFLLESLTFDEIQKGIIWAENLSLEDKKELSTANREYSLTKYNLVNFKSRFKSLIVKYL